MIPPHRADLPLRSEQDQADFFADALARSAQAIDQLGVIEHDIELANMRIRLRFAGLTLEQQLLPALAHRRVAADSQCPPAMTINVWDSESAGLANCPPPVEKHCLSERGDIWTFTSKRYRSAFHYSEFSLNLLDHETGQAVYWLNSANDLAYWTIASPFRSLIHWCAERHGAQLVHAAAVGLAGKGVLITGRGGVGKSTSALSCVEGGFEYVGDDYVLLTNDNGARAHSIYRTAKIEQPDLARYPALVAGSARNCGGEADGRADAKAVLFLNEGVVDSLAIAAVLTPQFGADDAASLKPVDHNYLIGAASYTTVAQLPHAGPQTTAFIEETFRHMPGRTLLLGKERGSVVPLIASILAEGIAPEAGQRQTAPLPLVSVIIPVYNGAAYLADAVASIVAQHYPAIELIVVDDGSPDDVAAAAAMLPLQPRVLHQHNQGPAAARNLGIRAASGEFLAFLDVDDRWPEQKLATAMHWLLDRPETDVVIGRAAVFQDRPDGAPEFLGSPAESFDDYIGAAVYRRRAFASAGLFDPLLRFAEDSDWFARATHFGVSIDRVDLTTLQVRRHPGNMTRERDAMELMPLRMLKNALDLRRGG